MWDVFSRLRLLALGLGVLAAGSGVEASVLSFKATKKNDVTITPGVCNLTTFKCTTGPVGKTCANNNDCPIGTNNLAVLAGDKIEVDMFLSAWANDFPIDIYPNNVRSFQVKLNRAGFVSNDNGTAKPFGWCGPVDKINCTTNAECVAANPTYPTCLTTPPTGCTCTPHAPENGGFITTERSDFLLYHLDGPLPECVTSFIDFKCFGVAENSSVPDPGGGASRYLSTLIVKVSANACGTFSIGSVQEITSTFIADQAPKPNVSLPTLQPLVLTVSDCSRQLLSCNPGHCNVDARISHDRLDQNQKKNTNQIVMTFSKKTGNCSNALTQTCSLNTECPAGGTCTFMSAANFEVTLYPYESNASCTGAGVPYACCTGPAAGNCDIIPIVSGVTPNGADPRITTLTLSRRIQQTRWTCIRDKGTPTVVGSNKRCCMSSLPADADNSLNIELNAIDVFEVLNNLGGCLNPPTCNEPLLPIERCDADRSLQCSPADLLMVVDLLNGADELNEVLGDTLPALFPACPLMTMPP